MDYIIITSAGYWGKGTSLVEAAKNANVRGQYVRGMVLQSDPRLFADAYVDEMGGLVRQWQEEVMEIPQVFRAAARDMGNLGYFNLKITKGNLIMATIDQ